MFWAVIAVAAPVALFSLLVLAARRGGVTREDFDDHDVSGWGAG